MNERIEELKKLATIRVNTPTVNTDGKVICDNWEEGISLSTFAVLIMRETFDWVVENVGLMEDTEWQALKRHFGVEE